MQYKGVCESILTADAPAAKTKNEIFENRAVGEPHLQIALDGRRPFSAVSVCRTISRPDIPDYAERRASRSPKTASKTPHLIDGESPSPSEWPQKTFAANRESDGFIFAPSLRGRQSSNSFSSTHDTAITAMKPATANGSKSFILYISLSFLSALAMHLGAHLVHTAFPLETPRIILQQRHKKTDPDIA